MKQERVILHVDLNSFFASVEMVFNPHLKDVPFAVGGDPEKRHGIVLAKNELAKKAGVKTGDTIWQAKQKIAGLVVLPARRKECVYYSKKAREIYESYTDCVEAFGIDECWLDVTGSQMLFGDGKKIADDIRARLKKELRLTASVGVSFNKVFAKIGSDYKKPDATTVITKENFREIVHKLPTHDMIMVGRKTAEKLARFGIATLGDLAASGEEFLAKHFGKHGEMMHRYANGLDDTPVQKSYFNEMPKSMGNSTTTKRDLVSQKDVKTVFALLAENVAMRLRASCLKGSVVSIGVRFSDLQWVSFQRKQFNATFLESEIRAAAVKLFEQNVAPPFAIRSLALSISALVHDGEKLQQQTFFDESKKQEKNERVEKAIYRINKKYGGRYVRVGSLRLDDDLVGEINLGSLIDDKGVVETDD